VWQNYDVNFSYWAEAQKARNRDLFIYRPEERYFSSFISDTLKGNRGISAWSVQYLYMLRLQNQLSVYPAVNMVANIGLFSDDATHTVSKKASAAYVPSAPMPFPLKHP
jgi:hypothetical protein